MTREETIDDEFVDTVLQIIEPLHPITETLQTRAATFSDWPPAPPPPAAFDEVLAVGTSPPRRRAQIYAVVRRPTTADPAR